MMLWKTKSGTAIVLVLFFIAVIVVSLVFTGIDKKNANAIPEQLTPTLFKDKVFLNSMRSKSQKEKDIILIKAAKILLKEIHSVTDNKLAHYKLRNFSSDDFNTVNPIIDFMLTIDSENGHGLYFRGEVYRLLNDNDRFPEYFQKYLEIEESIGNGLEKVTEAGLCYETPHGYCEQRTAWISQLLANFYYNEGISESDSTKKSEFFYTAIKHIQNVRNHFPTGFVSSPVTLSTSELESNLNCLLL